MSRFSKATQNCTHMLTSETLCLHTASAGGLKMVDSVRVQVLLPPDQAERFDGYCRELGFKKSTLIARLIREHLDQEHFKPQHQLFEASRGGRKKR
jgi:hypothetical protein